MTTICIIDDKGNARLLSYYVDPSVMYVILFLLEYPYVYSFNDLLQKDFTFLEQIMHISNFDSYNDQIVFQYWGRLLFIFISRME